MNIVPKYQFSVSLDLINRYHAWNDIFLQWDSNVNNTLGVWIAFLDAQRCFRRKQQNKKEQ